MLDQSTIDGKEETFPLSRTSSTGSWDLLDNRTSGGMRSRGRSSGTGCSNAGLTPAAHSPPPENLYHASDSEAEQHSPDDRTRADYLRNELCLTRIQVDSERDKYISLYGYAQESIDKLITFLCVNANLASAPPSTVQEFRRLQQQADLLKDALSAQSQAARDAEADLRSLEDQISGLGVWYVHLPEMQL